MSKLLKEILNINKLIKSLIIEEDIDGIEKSLEEKKQLMEKYNKDKSKLKDDHLIEMINQLDQENIKNLDKLMHKTKEEIEKIRFQKGQVRNKNSKVKKYKSTQLNSGYRFDRKK